MRYRPSAPARTVRTAPVASRVAVIAASGTAAPDGSSTRPWIDACPNTAIGINASAMKRSIAASTITAGSTRAARSAARRAARSVFLVRRVVPRLVQFREPPAFGNRAQKFGWQSARLLVASRPVPGFVTSRQTFVCRCQSAFLAVSAICSIVGLSFGAARSPFEPWTAQRLQRSLTGHLNRGIDGISAACR